MEQLTVPHQQKVRNKTHNHLEMNHRVFSEEEIDTGTMVPDPITSQSQTNTHPQSTKKGTVTKKMGNRFNIPFTHNASARTLKTMPL